MLLGIFAALGSMAAAQSPPPNIVFILSDNQSASALACYGNKDVQTPHLDRLAAEGVRFTQAYAASGMCSSTRATLMTGLMPSQHGLHNALFDPWVEQQAPGWNAVAEFRSLPYTLAQHGFQTAMIGKWHLGDTRQPSLGFRHWVALPYGHTIDFWDNELIDNGRRYPVKDRHIVDVFADKAVDYLAQVDPERPFYLQLNLDGPYALPPSNYGPARNRHYPHYVGKTFASMPVLPVNDDILARLSGPYTPEFVFDDANLDQIWDHLLYRTIRMQGDKQSYANFLSQNSIVDDAVGRVMEALAANGQLDNTVVIYSADQGNLYGQHGSWGHTIWFTPARLYQDTVNVPLIIRHPNHSGGVTSNRLLGQYDIAPTLLALAGIQDVNFANSPGRSFAGEVDPAAVSTEAPLAVFFEQEESRGLRTHRYAYWKRLDGMGQPELYDLDQDPGETHNRYAELKDSAVVTQLDQQLTSFFNRYSTPEYDLWNGGITKGTSPKMPIWIAHNPLPWLLKLWRDEFGSQPDIPAFSE